MALASSEDEGKCLDWPTFLLLNRLGYPFPDSRPTLAYSQVSESSGGREACASPGHPRRGIRLLPVDKNLCGFGSRHSCSHPFGMKALRLDRSITRVLSNDFLRSLFARLHRYSNVQFPLEARAA